jgi:hypothetical protein
LVAEATSVTQRESLSRSAANTLRALQSWAEEGGDMRTGTDGVFLADKFVVSFRLHATFPELHTLYGGADNGLNHFLKTHVAALESDSGYTLDKNSLAYLNMVLGDAWDAAIAEEPDIALWTATYDASASVNKHLTWFANNFALGSDFDGGEVYDNPRLECGDGQTIWSQGSQVYTHVVDLSDTDSSLSVMAIGNTDGVSDGWWDSQGTLWADGHFKSAPLSEGSIDALVSVEEEMIYVP